MRRKYLTPPCYRLVPKPFVFAPDEEKFLLEVPFMRDLYADDRPCIYIAQNITENRSAPDWLKEIKRTNYLYNIIDPVDAKYQFPQGCPVEIEVKLDIVLCAHSVAIILDLTKGPSVGATVEVTMSRIMQKEIIGVIKPEQRVSPFSRFLCNSIQQCDKPITIFKSEDVYERRA